MKIVNIAGQRVAIDDVTGRLQTDGAMKDQAPFDGVKITRLIGDGSSETLEELKGSALETNLREIVLVPADGTGVVYMNDGVASGATGELPATGQSMALDKTAADTLELLITNLQAVTLFEYTQS